MPDVETEDKVKSISPRIFYSKSPALLRIVIGGEVEPWKRYALLTWWVLWFLCGVYLITQGLNTGLPLETRVIIFVMLSFWIYYLVRELRVLVFRFRGAEIIEISDGKFTHIKRVFGRERGMTYECANMQGIRLSGIEDKTFARVMGDSFWVLGGERLVFDYGKDKVAFGMQLNEVETASVMRLIKKQLHR